MVTFNFPANYIFWKHFFCVWLKLLNFELIHSLLHPQIVIILYIFRIIAASQHIYNYVISLKYSFIWMFCNIVFYSSFFWSYYYHLGWILYIPVDLKIIEGYFICLRAFLRVTCLLWSTVSLFQVQENCFKQVHIFPAWIFLWIYKFIRSFRCPLSCSKYFCYCSSLSSVFLE